MNDNKLRDDLAEAYANQFSLFKGNKFTDKRAFKSGYDAAESHYKAEVKKLMDLLAHTKYPDLNKQE